MEENKRRAGEKEKAISSRPSERAAVVVPTPSLPTKQWRFYGPFVFCSIREGDATLWGKSRVISRHTTHTATPEVSLLLGMRVEKFLKTFD